MTRQTEIELAAELEAARAELQAWRWAKIMGWNGPSKNVHGNWIAGPSGEGHCYVMSGPCECPQAQGDAPGKIS